jgi:hypothetical protein
MSTPIPDLSDFRSLDAFKHWFASLPTAEQHRVRLAMRAKAGRTRYDEDEDELELEPEDSPRDSVDSFSGYQISQRPIRRSVTDRAKPQPLPREPRPKSGAKTASARRRTPLAPTLTPFPVPFTSRFTFTSDAWLKAERMSCTETVLRVAQQLIAHDLVSGEISIALGGAEIARADRASFPVEEFLESFGFTKADAESANWRGSYIEGKSQRSISLHDRSDVPQLVAPLARGGRLLLEASAGPLNPTKSPVEHKLLFGLIGRALCYEDVDAGDVLAIAVPRSARFRQLIARFRKSPRLEKTALVYYMVARGGDIDGLQKLKRQ